MQQSGRRPSPAATSIAVAALVGVAGCATGGGAPATAAASTSSPASSPAAGRLALLGTQPGEQLSGVLVVDLATGQRSRVGGDQEAWSPAWVDGGQRLALVRRTTPDGPGQLVITDADGSGQDVIVDATAEVTGATSTPDGQLLVWIGRTGAGSRSCEPAVPDAPLGLYVAGGDGSDVRRVSDLPATARDAVPSPDGRTVAFVDAGPDAEPCTGGDARMVLLDVATGTQRVVTGMTQRAGVPRWSPDGSTIAVDGDDFVADQTRDLVLVDVAAVAARRLVTDDVIETAPVFSPDGRHLAMLRRDDAPGLDSAAVVLADVDGSDPQVLALTGTDDQDLAWSPDGLVLAVAGSVVEPLCDEAETQAPAGGGASADSLDGSCDVAAATPGVRVVDVATGASRLVSDTTSLLQAGLTFAP